MTGIVEVFTAGEWRAAIDVNFLPDWPTLRHTWYEHAHHSSLMPLPDGVVADSRYADTWLPLTDMLAFPLDYTAQPEYVTFLQMCRLLGERYGTENVRVVFWKDM